MPSAHLVVSEQFYRFENRGRGWQVFSHAVTPEPPLISFPDRVPVRSVDDGRRPTFLSSLIQGFSRRVAAVPEAPPVIPDEAEAEPRYFERSDIVELQISLPRDYETS